jgi:hypothetical protein
MDHTLGMRESDGVAAFLKNGQQRGERILLRRGLEILGEEIEHLVQGDAPHHLHRVEKLPLVIQADLVDGDDVRMFELAGDLGLLDEAHHVAFLPDCEHHFHRDPAFHGALLRGEDRAHAALRHDRADVVAMKGEKFLGQPLPNGLQRQAGGWRRRRRGERMADFQFHVAEADLLVR